MRLAALVSIGLLLGPLAERRPRDAASEAPGGSFERAPILLVGVDGMEWNVVLPMLRAGRLPALEKLMQRGSFGLLESRSAVSPALWTSIATGKSLEKHGILNFLRSDEPPILYTSLDRKTKALWNILTDYQRSVDCIGWFDTFPVEPIDGVMVAQANTAELERERGLAKGSLLRGIKGQVFPAEREAEFFEVVHGVERDLPELVDEIVGSAPVTSQSDASKRIAESTWAFKADTIYERIATRLLAEDPPALMAVYFGAADVASHRFWPLAYPKDLVGRSLAHRSMGGRLMRSLDAHPFFSSLLGDRFWLQMGPDPDSPWSGVLFRTYERLDRAIGRLIASLPPAATVLVVSDHGMGPWGHTEAPPGFLLAAGANIRRLQAPPPRELQRHDLRRVGSFLDVTPTLLTLLGIPLGRDMDGQVMEALLQPRDPERPRPIPVASHDTAQWLALRARQPRIDRQDDERLDQLRALGYIQ